MITKYVSISEAIELLNLCVYLTYNLANKSKINSIVYDSIFSQGCVARHLIKMGV